MIVVDMQLWGAVTKKKVMLGLLIIDNVQTYDKGNTADYRVRVWAKGVTMNHILHGRKPIREDLVLGHKRKAEPVWNLVAKALLKMGYS